MLIGVECACVFVGVSVRALLASFFSQIVYYIISCTRPSTDIVKG